MYIIFTPWWFVFSGYRLFEQGAFCQVPRRRISSKDYTVRPACLIWKVLPLVNSLFLPNKIIGGSD
jgi:hypothetical protein